MELSVFDIIGNGVSNQEISGTIAQKLKDKYNEDFCVKMIGNRYGTANDDFVLAYCFPKNNEKVLFTASLNKDETVLEDDYYLKNVSFMLGDTFENEFKKNNAEVIAKIKTIGINKLNENLSIKEFIENYEETSFLAKFICSKKIDEEILKDIYSQVEKEYKNINLKSAVYYMENEKLEEFKDVAQKIPDITEAIIEKYNAKEEKIIKISEGNVVIIK